LGVRVLGGLALELITSKRTSHSYPILMTLQHRLAALAAVFTLLVSSGFGCSGEQQAKPNPPTEASKDAGGKTARDAGTADVPVGTPDASVDSSKPPTSGTGGTTPPPTGTGGTTPPPTSGTGGTTPPPTTGTGGTTPPPMTPPPTTTPPTTTPPPAMSLRIAAFGDFGTDGTEEGDVADLVHGWAPDHVITLGDNNYSSGGADTIDAHIGKYYREFIGSYRGSYGPGSATNRFWPSPGNHDWVAPNLKPYTDYFTLPGNERYYDVDLGLVHLYAMDSDGHEPDGVTATSKQALWLKDKLAASKSCFDLVYFHHPPYSTGEHGSETGMRWPFEAWGAEGVLAGHDHDYERFQVGGIPYFVVGTAGAGLRPFVASALPETKYRNADTYGAMLITATATGITFDFWSRDGQKLDSLSVPKTCR
jgi:tartrate-resistant acid phosphatase type 5